MSRWSCNVIVVDDSLRFTLHVWRYLGGAVGFGIGQSRSTPGGGAPVGAESVAAREAEASWSRLDTSLGEVTVWWVRLDADLELTQKRIAKVWRQLDPGPVVCVMDVREEPSGSPEAAAVERGEAGEEKRRKALVEPKTELAQVNALVKGLREKARDSKRDVTFFIVSSLAPPPGNEVQAEGGDTTGNRERWPKGREVLPKSPETLQEILRATRPESRSSQAEVAGGAATDGVRQGGGNGGAQAHERSLHVLVTGAGFEYPATAGGVDHFGIPGIGKLLREMKTPFSSSDSLKDDEEAPYMLLEEPKRVWDLPGVTSVGPRRLRGRRGVGLSVSAARRLTLDEWWNEVLRGAPALVEKPGERDAGSDEDYRVDVRAKERELREAFRSVFVRYDFGQLLQALCAAQLDWTLWLTTNYTRFAERALGASAHWREQLGSSSFSKIDIEGQEAVFPVLRGAHRAGTNGEREGSRRPYRTIDTSAEAVDLMRELEADAATKIQRRSRLLFKLHGDITHLRTMAIAGEDKEAYSQLSLPVDDLHMVYSCAGSFLSRFLLERRNQLGEARFGREKLTWHIVGHGLQDKVLCDLISRVRRSVPDLRMEFRVVQPAGTAAKKAEEYLCSALEKAVGAPQTAKDLEVFERLNQIRQIDRTAERYILELARDSEGGEIPPFREDVGKTVSAARVRSRGRGPRPPHPKPAKRLSKATK
jgi:hypothetical protein